MPRAAPGALSNLVVTVSHKHGAHSQVWLDTAQSLLPRFQAAHALGLRGVGCWNLEHLYWPAPGTATDAEVASMWGAVAQGFLHPGHAAAQRSVEVVVVA